MASVTEGETEGLEQAEQGSTATGDAPGPSTTYIRQPKPKDPVRPVPTNSAPSLVIIREIYDSENANEMFEQQLEQALASSTDTIVIEPYKLGDETARWISVGNCLHKTAVLAGFGSILAGFVWPDKPFVYIPATIISSLCTGLYSISWQFDPCCKYQVETDARQLAQLSLRELNTSSPVVLVRRDDTRRKILHTAVTFACVAQTGLKLYYPFLNQLFGRASREALGTNEPPGLAGRLVVSELPNSSSQPSPASSTSFMSVLGSGFNKP